MANENDVFSADHVETPVEIDLNDLVGEGRKYKTPDELAKAYANLERHARTLEGENADIRAQLDVNANTPNPTDEGHNGREQAPSGDNHDAPPNKAPTSGKEVDFRSQIREEVQALNDAERQRNNVEAAASKMIEVYGDSAKANEAVVKRAGELGVSVDWLKDSAARSPAAFLATMGITSHGSSSSTPASHTEVNLNRQNTGNLRNFEYYDKIRKDNPKLYFSAATQTEMMNEARKQGSDFYRRT